MNTVTIEKREAYETNTDPQKRCYSGCHFSSGIVWSNWVTFAVTTEKNAESRLQFWRDLNQIAVNGRGESPAEFRLKPEGIPMKQYNYFLELLTDDDVRVYYMGKSYGYFESDLKLTGTGTLSEIQRILKSIEIVSGHKCTDFTGEFLQECWDEVWGLDSESVKVTRNGNQEYTFTVEEVPVIKHVAKGEKPVTTPERYQYAIDLAEKVMKRQDDEISKLKMRITRLMREKLK